MIDRLIDWIHRLRHGHRPDRDAGHDGTGLDWHRIDATDRAGDFGAITED